jgi:hypothetical protein
MELFYVHTSLLFVIFFIIAYCFYKYFDTIIVNSKKNAAFLFELLDDFDFIFLKYIDRAESIDQSSFSYLIVSLVNIVFSRNYLFFEGYGKFIISLMYLKKRFFKWNYNFFLFLFFCVLKSLYWFFYRILSIPFTVFGFIS